MSTHTSGPWAVSNVGWIASVSTRQTICAMYAVRSGLDHSESDANARLIAQAPTMHDLLLRLVDVVEALDGTSVENEKLVDDYRAWRAQSTPQPADVRADQPLSES